MQYLLGIEIIPTSNILVNAESTFQPSESQSIQFTPFELPLEYEQKDQHPSPFHVFLMSDLIKQREIRNKSGELNFARRKSYKTKMGIYQADEYKPLDAN